MKNDKTKETEKQAKEEIAVNLEELNEIETLVESKINASYEEHLTSLGQGTTEENVVKKLIQLN